MFVSASVTCFFAPVIDDPKNSGSIGVGFTIDRGVEVRLAEKTTFNGKKIRLPTLEYVLSKLGYEGGAEIKSDLPLGCGFGLSGATALASALEVNEKLGLNLSLFQIADLAHEAEVLNRTGLGDVTTQCHGGFVVRKNASAPSICSVDRFLWDVEMDFLVMGELKTSEILEGNLKEVYKIGVECLKKFLKRPSISYLFEVSKEFTLRCGFADDDILDAIEAVESCGGLASMIMLGKGVFALNGDVLRELKGFYTKSRVVWYGIKKSL
ncbi:pantoate kinase [Archaeoglobus profundus]|uniref:Pantoate kinase n=1 Tax=Archaeoglobus profundus (strain DSM 5631 / JCM 9629 / NBRC 100127 / Av18) TaxID=572546 RepID=D2RGS4_ARCPA|nr:pantoate kinase [Archaeoglobus profundus]ADB57499.1 GHMP kinase [Archaeoglobus profundus DSM 5631]